MFLVSDSQTQRHGKIRAFIEQGEPVIAVLLAAADFEWTIRRAILALGESPTTLIRNSVLSRRSGLNDYKDAWRSEIRWRDHRSLAQVLSNWEVLKDAFLLRHRLVHGVSGTTGMQYAEDRVCAILSASEQIVAFAQSHSVNLFDRLPVRRRAKTARIAA